MAAHRPEHRVELDLLEDLLPIESAARALKGLVIGPALLAQGLGDVPIQVDDGIGAMLLLIYGSNHSRIV